MAAKKRKTRKKEVETTSELFLRLFAVVDSYCLLIALRRLRSTNF
jgi:hypothetical protein